MIVDASGQLAEVIALEDKASKGSSGRVIPMNKLLRSLLISYTTGRLGDLSWYVIQTERSEKFSANAVAVFFKRLYKKLGLVGCSSHSGRRTFITNCARKTSTVGGSLRDVMALAGHSSLSQTARYIDVNSDAQRAMVDGLYSSLR
jgi:integrase